MIWFLMLFDTFLLEKVFSTICFLQLSYDNIFFHVGPYFFFKAFMYQVSCTYAIRKNHHYIADIYMHLYFVYFHFSLTGDHSFLPPKIKGGLSFLKFGQRGGS